MGATRIGVIAEGPIDHVLLSALLQRMARDRADFRWPVLPEDVAEHFPTRKRGHGGVLDAVRRLVTALTSPEYDGYSFFAIILDRRTRPVQKEVHKLIRDKDRFVVGIAIEEIEAWWLGDRRSTLGWCELRDPLPAGVRYGERDYEAEQDPEPKRTLDEVTELSPCLDRRYGVGNVVLASDFAEIWKGSARLRDIEGQCPTGFRPFCRDATNAFRRAKARSRP